MPEHPEGYCVVTQNTTFEPGTYVLMYGIQIGADSVVLDCNGATLDGGSPGQGNGFDTVYGIYIGGKSGVIIKNCRVMGYDGWESSGIHIRNSSINNAIESNEILQNYFGIWTHSSDNNSFTYNIIHSNSYGLMLAYADGNLICWNNFQYNIEYHASDNTDDNSWDNGYIDGGNYWGETCVDVLNDSTGEAGSDGICDDPVSFENIIDHYPYAAESGWLLNRPPILELADQETDEGLLLSFQVEGIDPNDDDLTYGTNADEILPSAYSFDAQTGLFEWTPTYSDSGKYAVEFTASDGAYSDADTIQIRVNDGYICGDSNCDRAVNVADAVYVINYIFKGGPAPCMGCKK